MVRKGREDSVPSRPLHRLRVLCAKLEAMTREEAMARIKHIALTTKNPADVAEFYKAAFGLKELRRNNGNVFLTDGYIHVAVLKTKGEAAPTWAPMGRISPASII